MPTKQVVVRMELDEYEKIEKKWERAGFKSLQEAGVHALRTAFEEVGPEEVPAKYRPYEAKFREILASGDEAVIRAVLSNVEVFHDRLRRPAGGRKAR